jgi:MATE family multidrug resistance protein
MNTVWFAKLAVHRHTPPQGVTVQVLRLAWPVVVEQMLGTAVGLVNTYIVGHLGAAALAAVGLSSQLVNLLTALFSAAGVGGTVLIARSIGAGEQREAETFAGQSLLLALALGALMAIPCLFWGGEMLRALGGAPDVVAPGRLYLLAVGTTMPLMALLFVGNAAIRGAGDTRTPMVIMSVVNGVNAVLSWGLVYGVGPLPALGVLGAGIGAAVGSAVGGVLVARALLRGRAAGGLRVSRAGLRPDGARAWRLLRIGLPSGAEQGLMRLAQVVMASVVTGLGTAAYAGHQLGIQLLSVAFTPGFAFSVAATTLVGQELGRQSPQRAAACTMTASWLALGVMCSGGVAAFFLAEPLVRFFTSDPGVIAQGAIAVRGCAFIQPSLAWYFVLSGALRGAGDTGYVLLAQALPIWLVRLPLSWLLGITAGLALPGIWAAMILDMSVRALMLGLRFRSGDWQRIRV